MKEIITITILILFASCSGNIALDENKESKIEIEVDSLTVSNSEAIVQKGIENELESDIQIQKNDTINYNDANYMNAYIVVADSSYDYYQLRTNMFKLKKSLNASIDTMARGYNAKKDLICLADNDPDEIYAGSYFPRRYPTESPVLSIEHFNYYSSSYNQENQSKILVVMISDKKTKADSMLTILLKEAPNAFILNDSLYMGCMH